MVNDQGLLDCMVFLAFIKHKPVRLEESGESAELLKRSSEGGEFGGSGSTNTDFTVSNGLVSHGVLGEVVTNHISLNLDGVPVLATVTLNY